jgi:hypothetical protein
MRLRMLAAAALVLTGVLAAVPALASRSASVIVVADHLNNPRQLAVASDGSIYVAEAGKAGPTCPTKEVCIGFSASITKIAAGKATRVIAGLLSAGGRDGTFTTGADGVGVATDGSILIAMTGAPCKELAGLPKRVKAQAAHLLVKRKGAIQSLGDLAKYECRFNPDHTDKNPNPYALWPLGRDHALVVDAGANALFDVKGTSVKVAALFPKNRLGGQSVPTSITKGPDGAYYVGEFGGESKAKPKRHQQRVFRVVPGQKPTVFAQGLDAISGVSFDAAGNLYVTELTIDPTNERNAKGDVVRIAKDGSRTRLGGGKLFFPAGGVIGRDGALYVANWSILPGSAPKGGPFKGKNGQVVRISLS